MNANANAQIKSWKIYALASSGGMWCSSQLAKLDVAAPYATVQLQRAACEQGEETQILFNVNHAVEFAGDASAKLLGLPAKVVATDVKVNKETKEAVFTLKTDPTSPVGKHSLVCQLTITQNGEPIVNRAGSVQFQIDKPLPPEPNAPPPPKKVAAKPKPVDPAVAAKPKPKPKPLTRLQKLRLAAKKRQEAKAAQGASGGEE